MRISDVSEPAPTEPQPTRRPVWSTKRSRRKAQSTLPTPEQLRRQNALLRCAWRNLGESAPVIAFLNSHNEHLGGQPLCLALESEEGLMRVEGLLGKMGAKA